MKPLAYYTDRNRLREYHYWIAIGAAIYVVLYLSNLVLSFQLGYGNTFDHLRTLPHGPFSWVFLFSSTYVVLEIIRRAILWGRRITRTH